MKLKFLLGCSFVTLLTFLAQNAEAQNPKAQKAEQPKYQTAIGVKFYPFAFTFKTFVGRRNRAIELLPDFDNGFRLTGLYEFHGNLNAEGNVKWYIGFGGHGGYYDNDGEDGASGGFDGVTGLDYKFKKAPINLSLDWQPSFEMVTPDTEIQGGRGGLAVRFAF